MNNGCGCDGKRSNSVSHKEPKKISCVNKCSHDPNKILDLLESVKLLYQRISKDICQYVKELELLQDYSHRYNLNQDDMLSVLEKRYNNLATMMYLSVRNHLAFTTNVRGLGEKIIKPTLAEYGPQTTLKYQNICRRCSDCDDCLGSLQKYSNSSKELGCRNFQKVKMTTNIAMFDNIDIQKMFIPDVDGNGNHSQVVGYLLNIGNISYRIYNARNIVFKATVHDPVYDQFGEQLSVQPFDKVTAERISSFFETIDDEVKNLGDVQTNLMTNVNFIDKYIRKFQSNACC
jgi:hypothetical protein